jgi:hypothetical protein
MATVDRLDRGCCQSLRKKGLYTFEFRKICGMALGTLRSATHKKTYFCLVHGSTLVLGQESWFPSFWDICFFLWMYII